MFLNCRVVNCCRVVVVKIQLKALEDSGSDLLASWLTNVSIPCMDRWLIGSLTGWGDWFVWWQSNWLTKSLTGRLSHWLSVGLTDWLTVCLIAWLTNWQMNEGGKFERYCGAASVGEYNRVILVLSTELIM